MIQTGRNDSKGCRDHGKYQYQVGKGCKDRKEQLENKDVRHGDHAKIAILPVEKRIPVFPETLHYAKAPAETLPEELAQGFRRFCIGNSLICMIYPVAGLE